ncbi:3'-5' exonuclease family protein [Streptosporangium sandarakinum]|uniref:hypothetical protein n=1 Tax=Streptosporangium sandarakinum TaxID=1260955 RepID=UPI003687380B
MEVNGDQIGQRRYWIVRTPGEPFRATRSSGWRSFNRGEVITRERYEHAPLFADVWPEMAAFIAARPLIAHNAAGDIAALRRGCDDVGVSWPSLTFACSLTLARRTWPKQRVDEHGVRGYRVFYLAAVLFPEAGLFQGEYEGDLDHGVVHDPLEDAEAAARVVLAAQRATATHTLAEVLAITGVPLLRVEPERRQIAGGGWISRHPIRLPVPRGVYYRDDVLRATALREGFLDIRACWRGDPDLIANYPRPGDPLKVWPSSLRRRRR